METLTTPMLRPAVRRLLVFVTVLSFGLLALPSLPAQSPAAGGGSMGGTVGNAATRALLQGALVEIPALGRQAFTDNLGEFTLRDLPVGEHVVAVSYIGLDPLQQTVTVGLGRRSVLNVDLKSSVYQMGEFKVTGEREGSALAITAQRNASNLKNVVALDSFGNLPNMSAAELAMRLPGVTGNLDDEGNVINPVVRGMAANLNRFTVDGGLIASSAGFNRQFQFQSMTGAMFEQLELIKGHTPDKGADSLGGTVNMKTRSPLALKEKRRFAYSFGVRWAPEFVDHIPLRRAHRSHPLLNGTYEEVFSVFGGERNLGVAVNAFYSENVSGRFRTIRDFQNTTSQPAYLWDYRTLEGYNNRKQTSLNVKVDYRFSAASKFSVNTIYNDAFEPGHRQYEVRAFTAQTIATLGANGQPTGTGAILPGFTDKVTQVRGVPASTVQITETMGNFLNRTRAADFGGEHEWGRWRADYNAGYSQAFVNLGNSGGGTLAISATGVGWILDRTASDLYPNFTQTEGPSLTNIANYTVGPLSSRDGSERNSQVSEVRGNLRYELPIRWPLALKTGFHWREQMADEVAADRRWNYVGSQPLPVNSSFVTWDRERTGRVLPYFESAGFIHGETPVDPSLWREDHYFRESSRFTGTRSVTETVTAGYAMAQGRAGQLGFLGGVRSERTEDKSQGWVRARVASTAAQQAADPVGAAERDYAGTARRLEGSYTKSFPSVHLTYDVTRAIKTRLSWSTGFGRPQFANLLPNETFSAAQGTLTVNNPALKPQTARNWDATLEYYFEPVGQLSAGWFHKAINDYIVTGILTGTVGSGPDNGYNGEYAGATLLTSSNAGSATVQGWEFSYQQQFSSLPGLLKGLGVSLNYTVIATEGDFGETAIRGTNEVAGFIPRTGNASLSYRYHRFTTRLLVNYTSGYIANYSAASAARNQYDVSRTTVNLGLVYELRPGCSLFCDVSNLTNARQESYRFVPAQMSRVILNPPTLTLGISGRF